jgi:hypothetical protein
LSVSEIQLLARSPDPWGRGLLAFLAGYLCSLCTFEWSLLWDFAPYAFRPLVAGLLTLGFLTTLVLHQMSRDGRVTTAIPALTWLAVVAWPLRLSPITATIVFSGLVLILILGTLNPRRAGMALLLALVMSLAMLAGVPVWPFGALACALAAVEVRRSEVSVRSGQAAKQRLEAEAESRTAEISWKGFAALFKAAAPGEGERFTTSLLADTTRIVESCGGRRIKGSDLNGLYRFPNESSLERCLGQLERYRLGIVDVLNSAHAPSIELIVARQ